MGVRAVMRMDARVWRNCYSIYLSVFQFAHKPQAIHPSRLEVQWIGNCESEGAAAEKEVKMGGGMSGGRDEKGGEQPKVEETEVSMRA